jgi:hypothetical protein
MIIIHPIGGLANRMRVISSGCQLASHKKEKLIVLWDKNHELNCPFNHLFRKIDNCIVISSSNLIFYYRRIVSSLMGKEILDKNITSEDFKNKYYKYYLRSCHQFYGNYNDLSVFHPLKAHIIVAGKYTNKNIIGLHIRRTDHSISIEKSPISLFENIIKKELTEKNDTQFYLSTDDIEVEKMLLKKYSANLIIRKKNCNRNTTEGIKDALIDFLALSMIKKIYGSYMSSFGEFASIFGKNEFITLKNDL